MGPKQDLEDWIRSSYGLIQEYTAIIQTSSDPKERLRAERAIQGQWDLIWGYLDQYVRLRPDPSAIPQDVYEIIASHYGEDQLAPIYVNSLLSSLNAKEFTHLCHKLLQEDGYRIKKDKRHAIALASREDPFGNVKTWLVHCIRLANPRDWVEHTQVYQELECLAERARFDAYLVIANAQFPQEAHRDFRAGIAGRLVTYWDRPILCDRLLNCHALWQTYIGPHQLTRRSPWLTAHYELVEDWIIQQAHGLAPRTFYEGNRPGWGEIKAGLDIRRNACWQGRSVPYPELLSAIAGQAARPGANTRFVLLSAEAGAGKSTALLRIGYDLCQLARDKGTDAHTVLRLREHKPPVAYPVIELYQRTRKPVYILMDLHNIDAQTRTLKEMLAELDREGVPATIVAAARTNEWQGVQGWSLVRGGGAVLADEARLTRLSQDEIDALVDLLAGHGLLREEYGLEPPLDAAARERMRKLLVEKSDRQLFVALMEITHGKGFEEILLDEYDHLPDKAQAAYRYVCLLYAYETPLPTDLLATILDTDLDDLVESVLAPSEGVIISADMDVGDALRARHPTIACTLKNRIEALRFDRYLKEMASDIVDVAAYHKGVERYAVLRLLLGLATDEAYAARDRRRMVQALVDAHSARIADMVYRARVEGRYIELAEWGRLYYELGELDRDKECLELALAMAPANDRDRLYHYYGRVLRRLQDPNAARYFEQAWNPDQDVAFLHDYARLSMDTGDLERAARLLEQALGKDPYNKACRKTYRILLDRLQTEGNKERLIRVCEAGLQENPRNVQTLCRLATALQALGRHEEAVQRFRAILAIENDHGIAMRDCASSLVALGPAHDEEAAGLYQRAIQVHTNKDLLWAQLRNDYALLLTRMGPQHSQQAEALWAEAIAGHPDFVWAYVNFGAYLLHDKQEPEKAVDLFRCALAIAEKKKGDLLPRVRERLRRTVET